ncbi:hypothetical protein BU17DRAFT_62680 [Hysterangium stoloniferum]|nr:hypothetical protein BU17DRAFT_62680 [Hysterangium stoloniferum]
MASIDIVAIHGIDSDRIDSWTADGSSQSWLEHKDMLPKDIPEARILTYGYNPTAHLDGYLSHIPLKALILVKKESHSSLNRLFAEVTKGIIFLGTPHQGVDVVKLYWIYGKLDNALKSDLAKYSEALQDQLLAHNTISHKYITKFFYENYQTKLPDGSQEIASPTLPASTSRFVTSSRA